jgi:pimeloyl-ACP methyl ester carboxylesterase
VIGERVCTTARHATFYHIAGPADGPAIVFVHGWPEIGLAWTHQMHALAALGYRVVAPDLRGFGRSALYRVHDAYAQREIVADLIELIDSLGIARALWVGHDWGAATVWNIVRHHPERCVAVAALCIPYATFDRGLDALCARVNRKQYPIETYPAGQFEYIAFYHEHFEIACAVFDADVTRSIKVLLRASDPSRAGNVYPTAFVRKKGGWFGGRAAPDVALDLTILSENDLVAYARAYERSGFFGPDVDNVRYADEAVSQTIDMPALFLSGLYDFVCDTERSSLMEPMRAACADLTIETIASGHWMMHERATETSDALIRFANRVFRRDRGVRSVMSNG